MTLDADEGPAGVIRIRKGEAGTLYWIEGWKSGEIEKVRDGRFDMGNCSGDVRCHGLGFASDLAEGFAPRHVRVAACHFNVCRVQT